MNWCLANPRTVVISKRERHIDGRAEQRASVHQISSAFPFIKEAACIRVSCCWKDNRDVQRCNDVEYRDDVLAAERRRAAPVTCPHAVVVVPWPRRAMGQRHRQARLVLRLRSSSHSASPGCDSASQHRTPPCLPPCLSLHCQVSPSTLPFPLLLLCHQEKQKQRLHRACH